ncbi:MAG TPA: SusC/RagA family TonB-linked outer membrane protein, partial [Parasegetibacter sp.]
AVVEFTNAYSERPVPLMPVPVPITGKVVDSTGRGIEGASIKLVPGNKGAATKADGTFTIPNVEPGKYKLIISYVGMETQEITITDVTKPVNVVMKARPEAIDDVVITGYSNVRKESFTGNSINVTQEQILKVANRNVIEVLQVFDPSFRLEKNNLMGSDPNTLPQFYIRGRSGIGVKELDEIDISQAALTNNPNLPIFIMDGYEVSSEKVYDYDPNRIKSITILKDAAATAIYGSRAANGVVVIETVPPVKGKLRATYNFVSSLTLPDLSDYNLMNAEEKLEAERLSGLYDPTGKTPANQMNLMNEYILKRNQVLRGINTDWIAQPLTNEFNQKHTLSVDGGSEEIRFGFLLRYDNQNGVMKKSARDRMGSGLTIEYRRNKVQFRNDFTYDIVKATNSPFGNFAEYTIKAPYHEIRDRTGAFIRNQAAWHSGGTDQLNLTNPLYEVYNTKNSSTSGYHAIANNFSFNWYILPQLQMRAQFAVSKQDNTARNFIDPASGRYTINVNTNFDDVGELGLTNSNSFRWSTNLFANYVNRIGGNNINFSIGLNTNATNSQSSYQRYTGFPSGSQNSPNFAAKMPTKPTFNDNKTRLFGSFAALNYSYNDIYLFDASMRLDGSSEFGTEKKYAPFWSLGTGLNLHKYPFLANHKIISKMRITGSLGELGKVNFPPYAAKDNFVLSQGWYRTGAGASLRYLGNPQLNWEKTSTYDAVLDMGFLRDRITLNVNWYNKITKDLVNDVDLPLSSGFALYKDNVGKIQNKGIEIYLRGDVYRSKDVLIAVYGNFNHNKNILLDISQSLKAYNEKVNAQYADYNTGSNASNYTRLTRYTTPYTKYVEGGSLTSIFGMYSLGINPMDGREVYAKRDGTITYDWNAADQVIIGDKSPKGQGSFGINASYKGFSLFASLLYEYGAQEYNSTLIAKVENVDIYNRNTDRRVLTQRWQQPGDVTPLKDIKQRNMATRPTSRFIQDYNALKFNSISLGYSLSPKMLKKIGASMFRVQLSTNNLATISTVLQERGLSYPFARTFDFSLNLGF